MYKLTYYMYARMANIKRRFRNVYEIHNFCYCHGMKCLYGNCLTGNTLSRLSAVSSSQWRWQLYNFSVLYKLNET